MNTVGNAQQPQQQSTTQEEYTDHEVVPSTVLVFFRPSVMISDLQVPPSLLVALKSEDLNAILSSKDEALLQRVRECAPIELVVRLEASFVAATQLCRKNATSLAFYCSEATQMQEVMEFLMISRQEIEGDNILCHSLTAITELQV